MIIYSKTEMNELPEACINCSMYVKTEYHVPEYYEIEDGDEIEVEGPLIHSFICIAKNGGATTHWPIDISHSKPKWCPLVTEQMVVDENNRRKWVPLACGSCTKRGNYSIDKKTLFCQIRDRAVCRDELPPEWCPARER